MGRKIIEEEVEKERHRIFAKIVAIPASTICFHWDDREDEDILFLNRNAVIAAIKKEVTNA